MEIQVSKTEEYVPHTLLIRAITLSDGVTRFSGPEVLSFVYSLTQGCASTERRVLTAPRMQWIDAHFTWDVHECLYEVAEMCAFMSPEEMIKSFGHDGLCVFMSLLGNAPEWVGDYSYIALMRTAFVKRVATWRNAALPVWVAENWDSVVEFFDDAELSPEVLESVCDDTGYVQVKHVYRLYRIVVTHLENVRIGEGGNAKHR